MISIILSRKGKVHTYNSNFTLFSFWERKENCCVNSNEYNLRGNLRIMRVSVSWDRHDGEPSEISSISHYRGEKHQTLFPRSGTASYLESCWANRWRDLLGRSEQKQLGSFSMDEIVSKLANWASGITRIVVLAWVPRVFPRVNIVYVCINGCAEIF